MLILSRKKGQSIVISKDIEIVVTAIEGDQVKIGVQAPKDVTIHRKEIIKAIEQSNREAAQETKSIQDLKKLVNQSFRNKPPQKDR